jgi:hypothetical protein
MESLFRTATRGPQIVRTAAVRLTWIACPSQTSFESTTQGVGRDQRKTLTTEPQPTGAAHTPSIILSYRINDFNEDVLFDV